MVVDLDQVPKLLVAVDPPAPPPRPVVGPVDRFLLVVLVLAFLALMAFLGFSIATTRKLGVPDLSSGVSVVAAGLLGAVINPLQEGVFWRRVLPAVVLLASAGIGVWAAVEIFAVPARPSAGTALTAALVAFSALFLDTSKITHPNS
ncbi:hypothetical protein P3T37_002224 [Kitasatospora sp. MAA4]|uniref:hypothetical protein n=1 Tax=Kitasatospora sp. MAA4 TaxID=3035093 RepID=UPI002474614F|nr:hypothetical protein [Kitasatospora sp. MAA4]MDH6132838.1 hypothetical protein [Kitasatospora sp. MAA4]